MDICVYEYDSILKFGKYKNKNLLEINQISNGYIDWCLNNIDNFCISEESMKTLMRLFPKMKFSDATFKANQFKQEVAKLNDSNIDDKVYSARLIELYEIYNKKNEINNIDIWD